MEVERKKCNRCKMNMTLDKFNKKRDDSYMKICIECNIKNRDNARANKCEHGKRKAQCKECGGSQICEHNRIKSRCKECGGSQICEHNRIKSTCKECGGSQICEHNKIKSKCKECGGVSICEHNRQKAECKECGGSQICEHNRRKAQCKECSDHIKVIIKNWVSQSKQSDKKYNRFDIVNYIDICFCKNLIEEYPNCYYCKCELQYVLFQGDLATIERLDNDLGHIKSNCVIACRTCNYKKIGSTLTDSGGSIQQ